MPDARLESAPATFSIEPCDYGEVRALMAGLDLAEPVAVTLVRRGYRTVEAARAFLDAAEEHDPFEFSAMAEVVERIRGAIAAGQRITVHGDYDVDGVCATAILIGALRRLAGKCDWLIPDRLGDGYGLTAESVSALTARRTEMLITVDCGIGSVAEVAAAEAAGIAVIVTDHHQPGEELPACPILHPVVSEYPFAELCGTGVAFKLASALVGEEAAASDLDLVALATVADLVPLRGENRCLVRRGLAVARRGRRPGLRALISSASIEPERLDEGDFAFRLGPRINAAGRLYRADAGVELMLTTDDGRAAQIAAELGRANHERREVELEVLRGAERALGELHAELAEAPGLVLGGEGWHPGVVGIVASRLAERLWRPVVLVALDEAGGGRGSGRSVPGFDLLAALDRCSDHLARYGGHRAAAGVELEPGALAAFRVAFAEACAEGTPSEGLKRSDSVDAIVGADGLGIEVAEQLTRLGPFGLGNPNVRLLVPNARLSDVRPMGEGDRHARFTLASGSRRALGVAFGVNGSLDAATGGPIDVSVGLELNHWNGAIEPRVVLGSVYQPASEPNPGNRASLGESEFWARFDAELGLITGAAPAAFPAGRREEIDRRGASIVATVAALASAGGAALVVCADALRRRELVERAARPARFGGGELAICSARLSDESLIDARLVRDGAGGVALCDWGALARDPGLAEGFAHVVVIDPPPFAELIAAARAGEGYLHQLGGPAEAEFALRCHADEWPSRSSLGELYSSLRTASNAGTALEAPRLRALLAGEGRTHPRGPEPAARSARVLAELGLVEWSDSGMVRTLMVVSSEGTDLERSASYRAYRNRYEEGRRYLSERRQPRRIRR